MRPRSGSKPQAARVPDPPGADPPAPGIPRGGGQPPVRYLNAFWNPPFGNVITTFRRDEQGRLLRSQVKAEHACFIPAARVTEQMLAGLRSSRHVTRINPEGEYVRVNWADSRICRKAAAKNGWFKEVHWVDVLEADVDPVRRWIADSGVQVARPRRVFLDIETDSRVPFSQKKEARVLIWSLVSGDGSFKQTGVLHEDSDLAERALLRDLWKAIDQFDQVVAWNGDRFDFEMVDLRSKYCGIAVERRRWLWLDHMVLFRRMNVSASESGDEKQSMGLEAVAKAVLGEHEEKLVHLGVGGASSWGMWEAGGEERERLRIYCLDDSEKMRRIEEKTGYIELLQTLCEATNCFPDTRGINPTQQVEGFLMALGRERGMRFPTHHYAEEGEEHAQFRGAFVMEPKRGILRDVHVADFARLYPSIILSWNMSPETWARDVRLSENPLTRPLYLSHLPLQRWPIPEGHCAAHDTEAVFANEPEGVLPAALREMLRLRKEWDAKKKACAPGTPEWKEADRRSTAYKIAANSFFGVVSSPFSRFFEKTVGESITQCGVWLISETIRAATARGWRVVYGDTDSIFVVGCSEGEFREFVERCNRELYPRLLEEKRCSRNFVALDYEKAFDRIVFVGKKRYAGKYSHFKGARATGASKPEIKGLEYKRGDTNRLAREFQKRAIDMLMSGEDDPAAFVELVQQWRDRVLQGEVTYDQVASSKRLSKSLREYTAKLKADGSKAALPSHVEVAWELRARGRDVGAGVRIDFLVVDGSSSPIKCVPGEDWETIDRGPADMKPSVEGVERERPWLDRYYLWEALVYPPTQRLLEAAFPAGPWGSFERVRPPKLRGRAAREPGLPGLDLGERVRAAPGAPEGGARTVSDRSDTSRSRRTKVAVPVEQVGLLFK